MNDFRNSSTESGIIVVRTDLHHTNRPNNMDLVRPTEDLHKRQTQVHQGGDHNVQNRYRRISPLQAPSKHTYPPSLNNHVQHPPNDLESQQHEQHNRSIQKMVDNIDFTKTEEVKQRFQSMLSHLFAQQREKTKSDEIMAAQQRKIEMLEQNAAQSSLVCAEIPTTSRYQHGMDT